MSVLWSDALTRIRTAFVKDPDSKKWTDAVLLIFANVALDDLSSYLPMAKKATLVANGTNYAFSLPTDLRTVNAVVWGNGTMVLPAIDMASRTGLIYRLPEEITTDSELGYLLDWPEEDKITFTCIPSEDVSLYYGAYRPHIVTGGTPAPTLPIGRHAWMEPALYCYVAMLCHEREGVTAAMLEQYKVRQDLNVGNPLNVEAREWWIQYKRLVDGNAPKQ